MLKRVLITTALSGALIGAAVAQTAQPPQTNPSAARDGAKEAEVQSQSSPSGQNTTMPAGQTGSQNMSMPSGQTGGMSGGQASFINAQQTDQWLSSNFIGTDVIGQDNEKIGDVSDILFDKSGKVIGYVVGVGGFLGIGAKNVALAPTSFQVVPADADRATTGANQGNTSGTRANSDEVKLKLDMTKDQLKQAASFESKRDQDAKARAASQPGAGSGGANRPATAPAPRQ